MLTGTYRYMISIYLAVSHTYITTDILFNIDKYSAGCMYIIYMCVYKAI